MADTYTQIYIQIVIVVQGREQVIPDKHKDSIYKYMTGITRNKGHKMIIINGMPDHLHIFISFNPNEALSAFVKELKRCSTNFINENKYVKGRFSWQEGYGAFSYSKSQKNTVYRYIENQKKHHQKKTFREEYLEFLRKFEVEYEEEYIFRDVFSD